MPAAARKPTAKKSAAKARAAKAPAAKKPAARRVAVPKFPPQILALEKINSIYQSRRLNGAGCRMLFSTYARGTVIPEHEHATENCGVVTSGEMHVKMDGRWRRYGPGDWYIVPKGKRHESRFVKDTCEIGFWFGP